MIRRSSMMRYIVFVFILSSQSMSLSLTGVLDDDFALLLASLSNITWLSVQNTRALISFSENPTHKILLVEKLDSFFVSFFAKCEDSLEETMQSPEIFEKLDQVESYSSEITADLIGVLQIETQHEIDSSIDAKEVVKGIITNYLETDPLSEIFNIINDRPSSHSLLTNSSASFVEEYQKLGEYCDDLVSQQQRVNTFLQYLQWTFTIKLHFIVSVVPIVYKELGVSDPNYVINRFLDQYNPLRVADMYYNIIKRFQGDISVDTEADTLVVYHRKFPKHAWIESFEITPYKTLFLEDCYSKLPPWAKSKGECSRITSPPGLCKFRNPGVICPLWFTCNRTSCDALAENTTVCLHESDKTREYEYFIPLDQAHTKKCKRPTFEMREKIFEDAGYLRTICKPCVCTCETEEKQFYFSTAPAMSDFTNNMVVVGAKFELEDDTLFIRIQQGRIRAGGIIDSRTVRWLPLKKISSERGKISLNESSSIDLNRVLLPPDRVITGLSLSRGPRNFNYRIALTVHTHSYDSENGLLSGRARSYSYASGNSEVERTDVISSTDADTNTIIRDKFISFQPSGGHNGGRTTLPLIDGRRVESGLNTPLSGAGLYFRKQPRGGLIGLELLTYDRRPLDDFDIRWEVPKPPRTND